MALVRESELKASLDVLGVTEHHCLEYEDGACGEVPLKEATERVAAIMKDVEADSVLTFGPEGMTGHPDHEAVSRWTSEAFRVAAKSGARLYHATKTPEYLERLGPVLGSVVFAPERPPVTDREDLAIDFELDDELLDLKMKALEAHRSQFEGLLAVFGQELFREDAQVEWFALAEVRV
jgi:LmbE family N-acetylglucosaminyl deacetylase